MRGLLSLGLAVLVAAAPAAAQPTDLPGQEDATVRAFLDEVELAIAGMDRERWLALLSATADRDQALAFFDAMVPQGVTRAVVKERDRSPLAGTLPGYGYQLIAEVFVETGPRGRIATWHLDIRRPRGSDEDRQPWRMVAQDRLSHVEGLHRLVLHPDRQFAAQNLVIRSVDLEVRLPSGQVFVAETPEGITALVLMGEGTMVFTPRPKEERGQLRLFAGTETLDAPFTTALVRLSPYEFRSRVGDSALLPVAGVDARAYRRALQVFEEDIGNSFTLDLSDLSRERWSLLPPPGDFVAEVRTRRFGKLTFARSSGEPEDVSLFQRGRRRNIALYASEQRIAARGASYSEDDLVEYDVLEYDIDATFTPEREWLQGRTRLTLRVKAFALAALTLKLADSLTVNSVVSDQLGRLLFLRVVNQGAIVVNLPQPVPQDFVLTLNVSYQGRLDRQGINDESMRPATGQQGGERQRPAFPQFEEQLIVPPEPNWLFSSRAHWYPQAQVTDYATANLRVTVPADYTVVASGVPEPDSPLRTLPPGGQGGRATFTFTALQPVRYLSMIVSRLTRVDAATVVLDIIPPDTAAGAPGAAALRGRPEPAPVGTRNTVALTVDANRRQEGRGRDAVSTVAEILRLYASLVGDIPYEAVQLAMVEDLLPGGHAPAYMAVLNNPLPTSPFTWKNDPTHFPNIPEFFLAHELAHQWFGQAVGWKNYHEQWLSEGFAQYFAALYARERRGDSAFRDILRQLRRWSLAESAEGPVSLGYRLGHIKGESRTFRALVYNKGALVLHMLRRLIGDDAFFRGLRRYYRDHRFRKAGTDDLRLAMERESGRDLQRFFARWVFDAVVPRLRYAISTGAGEVVVRIEQGDDVVDVPVTVTVQLADGSVVEEVVRVSEPVTEARLAVAGPVRGVSVNDDHAALAAFERVR